MDLNFWTKKLREAERELEAATKRSDVNAAAKKLQLAKAELKALERQGPRASECSRNNASSGESATSDGYSMSSGPVTVNRGMAGV
jgi:hypothetical protein